MKISRINLFRSLVTLLAVMGMLILPASNVLAATIKDVTYDFASPLFGLTAAPDGSLLVADAGAGIVELRKGTGSLVAELPGVTDVAVIGRGDMLAITGKSDAPNAELLYRISRGKIQQVADLMEFETNVNPDGGEIDSNPFDVEVLNGGKYLVADAGGNDLLIVDRRGNVDWIATLPEEMAPTAHIKELVGCPNPPPGFEFVCGLPDMMPAQAVATSVAIGPDGAYYVGELKGFPSPTGMSRIWRIEPGTRHAVCGTDPACSVVATGFTAIVDLAFGPGGMLYVTEIDEAGWAAVELGMGGVGGTVNACDSSTWTCSELATQLQIPIAVAVDKKGNISAAVSALIPGAAQVITLP